MHPVLWILGAVGSVVALAVATESPEEKAMRQKAIEDQKRKIEQQRLEKKRLRRERWKTRLSLFRHWEYGVIALFSLIIFGVGVIAGPDFIRLYDRLTSTPSVAIDLSPEINDELQLLIDSYVQLHRLELELAEVSQSIEDKEAQHAFNLEVISQSSDLTEDVDSENVKIGNVFYASELIVQDRMVREKKAEKLVNDLNLFRKKEIQMQASINRNKELISAQEETLDSTQVEKAQLLALRQVTGNLSTTVLSDYSLYAHLVVAESEFQSFKMDYLRNRQNADELSSLIDWEQTQVLISDSEWEILASLKMPSRADEKTKVFLEIIELNDQKKINEALAMVNGILSKDPADYLAHSFKGCLFIKMDRYEEALDSFNKSLEISPNFEDARLGKAASLSLRAQRNSWHPTSLVWQSEANVIWSDLIANSSDSGIVDSAVNSQNLGKGIYYFMRVP